mmetsp:Transcript_16078/g.44812  ORF Transcript_16078/g.44812 Transcript_16078/m.44812 type:complete len:491 (+) Transcript_16078:104-1576(+)
MLVPIRASRFCRSAVLGQAAVCPTVALLIGECCRRGLRGAPAGAARLSSTPSQEPSQEVQAAVVGSGPAGMYTAQKLLKEYGDGVTVHVLDRLPTPFGLVRSGVAPDHADTKNVVNQFNSILDDPRVKYFGNVNVGKDVTLGQLREMYHAVVLAYGTEADRRLGIPGEDLTGVFSARDFVWWMNAHPDCTSLPVDLTTVRSVAILGLGNVALDCARVLLQTPTGPLAATDISGQALAKLRSSNVESVHIIGRRGIAQAPSCHSPPCDAHEEALPSHLLNGRMLFAKASPSSLPLSSLPPQAQFTGKELKEMLFEIPGVQTVVEAEQLTLSKLDRAEVSASRQKKRIVDLISKAAKEPRGESGRRLHFHFLRSPTEILANPSGRANALILEKNVLKPGEDGGEQRAKGTGETEQLPVDLVLTCIGYRGLPMDGLPFDNRRGVIPNTHGRVDGHTGVYVAGWIGRGPSGKVGKSCLPPPPLNALSPPLSFVS